MSTNESPDLIRMHELAVRNQHDSLTADEKVELDQLRHLAIQLEIVHSQVRLALISHPQAGPSSSPPTPAPGPGRSAR
jgi:hypothetical protein